METTGTQESKTDYTVSFNTSQFIDCLKAADELYIKIYHATADVCGDNFADKEVERIVLPQITELRKGIHRLMEYSIDEQLSIKGSTTI